jgi:hypothetical protein
MNRHILSGLWSALVVAVAATYVGAAVAGFRYTSGVSVTSSWATGAAGSARNSSSTKEYLYCTLTGTTSSLTAQCLAGTSAGASATCTTTNPYLVQVVQKMSSDSYVQFNFNASTGQCNSIMVASGSDYAPKIN